MIDFRLLKSFVYVARFKHFGKAAEALNVTQPGVSQHITKIEELLGYKLIERTKRSVILTPAGESLLANGELILSIMNRMKEEGRRVSQGLLGRITLGMSSSVIYTDIPQKISKFKENTPGVEMRFRVQGGDQLRALLEVGEIDAAITTLPVHESKYKAVVVGHQNMAIAINCKHRLADKKSLTIAALRDEPFIVVPREQHPTNHDLLIAKFRAMGAELNITAYETAFPNVIARVSMGEGVGFVAAGYSRERYEAVNIVPLNDTDLSVTPIFAVARKDLVKPEIDRLFDFLRKDKKTQ